MSTLTFEARLALGPERRAEPTALVGFWAAVAAAGASIAYSVAQLLAIAGWLPYPWDQILVFAPSLLLAPAFVILMVCVHHAAPAGKRLWSQAGLAFAVLYAALVSLVYIVQLLVVIPETLRGNGQAVTLVAASAGSFMMAIDALGYGFRSLATLLAAPVFGTSGLERWIRWFFIANGLLALPIVLAFLVPWLLALGAFWMVTVPGATSLLALYFQRAGGIDAWPRAGIPVPNEQWRR